MDVAREFPQQHHEYPSLTINASNSRLQTDVSKVRTVEDALIEVLLRGATEIICKMGENAALSPLGSYRCLRVCLLRWTLHHHPKMKPLHPLRHLQHTKFFRKTFRQSTLGSPHFEIVHDFPPVPVDDTVGSSHHRRSPVLCSPSRQIRAIEAQKALALVSSCNCR